MGKLYDLLMKDYRLKEGLNACINCGTCTAICPAAEFYRYDPRRIVDIVQSKDEEEIEKLTGAEDFENYLDSFLYLYREHSDMLRFNQNFNLYIRSGEIPADRMNPYTEMIRAQARRFSITYQKGKEDGTLRTDMPEEEMFSATMHLMLAAATRFAVGLAYRPEGGADPLQELLLLKNMLMKEYTCA